MIMHDYVLALLFGGATVSLAGVLYIRWLWQLKYVLAGVAVVVLSAFACILLWRTYNVFSLLIAMTCVYQCVNIARLTTERRNTQHAKRAVITSFWSLFGIQVLLGLTWYAYDGGWLPSLGLTHVALVQLVLACIGLTTILINVARSRATWHDITETESKLPTVTVAIPARNETTSLAECLQSIVASDYPKLETLVLDDCSTDTTPAIIKGFAQSGVRFLKGRPAERNWLAKNQAYNDLALNATGELILFCGVDVRFERKTISRLVQRLHASNLDMLTVLPRRSLVNPLGFFLQPMRYWWELAMPRFLMKQPASLTTCWLVDRAKLLDMGGFKAVPRTIRPEAYFAREFRRKGGYTFFIGGKGLGLESMKSWRDQFNTAMRVRYPEVHYRPDRVFMLTVFEMFVLAGPALTMIVSLIVGNTNALAFSALAFAGLTFAHMLVIALSAPKAIWLGAINYLLVALIEIGIVNESMRRHEFGEVHWKGRNICELDLEVIPHLPEL